MSLADPALSWGAASDIGKVRSENQDAYVADSELGLFVVSDGIGGHQGGALASRIVTEVLPTLVRDKLTVMDACDTSVFKSILKKTILELSKHMRKEAAAQRGLSGMGATLVMASLHGSRCFIANVGDSRAYLFRKGGLSQLTEDHSIVGLLLRVGLITRAKAKYYPARGELTRSIGMRKDAHPYVSALDLEEGDRLLLCSDGLTGMIEDEEICAILQDHVEPEIAARALIDAANTAGGHDNITAVIIDWLSANGEH
jgi:protein phosphatase